MALVLVMVLGILRWRHTMGPKGRPDVDPE